MGIRVSTGDSAALPNDFLQVQLSRWSVSRMLVLLVVNVDNPRYILSSPPDVGGNDFFVATSASFRPLNNYQAAPSPHFHPNCVSISHFVCRLADPNTFPDSRWLLQAHYVGPVFDLHLQRCNGPLV